eukprot:c17530_g1_i1 orf=444-806(+)
MEGMGTKANQEANQLPGLEDGQSWEAFNNGFCEVQKILEENKVLIGEINHNQESKVPENLSRNVGLIKELNSNMTHVVGLYTDLSSSFVNFMDGEIKDDMDMKEEGPPSVAVGQKRTRAT